MVLAPHGVITADEARERARLVLAEAATGGDPHGLKMDHRREMTVAELCELYMVEGTAKRMPRPCALASEPACPKSAYKFRTLRPAGSRWLAPA